MEEFMNEELLLTQEGYDNIVAEYDAIVKSITPQTLADFAKEVLKGYKKEIVQLPTE